MTERYPFEVVEKIQDDVAVIKIEDDDAMIKNEDDNTRIKVDLYMYESESEKAQKDQEKKDLLKEKLKAVGEARAKQDDKSEEKNDVEKVIEEDDTAPYTTDVADVEQDIIEKEMLKEQQKKIAQIEAKIDAL